MEGDKEKDTKHNKAPLPLSGACQQTSVRHGSESRSRRRKHCWPILIWHIAKLASFNLKGSFLIGNVVWMERNVSLYLWTRWGAAKAHSCCLSLSFLLQTLVKVVSWIHHEEKSKWQEDMSKQKVDYTKLAVPTELV